MTGIVFEVMQVQAFSTIDKDNPSYCNGYEPFTLSIDKISVNLRPIKLHKYMSSLYFAKR